MTYLEELQQAVATATRSHQDASEWLAAGATYDHRQRELERAERAALTQLERAQRALKRALACAVTPSHQGITFAPHPWHSRTILAYCPDCVDYDFDGESYIPDHVTGEGETESEALEDYHDRCGT